jgi:hypothetical protein
MDPKKAANLMRARIQEAQNQQIQWIWMDTDGEQTGRHMDAIESSGNEKIR